MRKTDAKKKNEVKSEMKIGCTTDYEMFKKIPYNREPENAPTAKISASLQLYGFVVPIVVTSDFYVIDGQTRLKAAKMLGIPVYYVVVPYYNNDESMPELVAALNTTQKGWKIKNFLDMWVYLKKAVYIFFKRIVEDYGVGLSNALILAGIYSDSKGNWNATPFKRGELKFTDEEKDLFKKRCIQHREIRYLNDSWSSFRSTAAFKRGLADVLVHRDYDHNRMLESLHKYPHKISLVKNNVESVKMFQDIYNMDRPKGSYVYFSTNGYKL